MELSPENGLAQVAGFWSGRWVQCLLYFDLNHLNIAVLLALFNYFFQCSCFQCSIWQLCLPGANEDRVSSTVLFLLGSSLVTPPPPGFFLTSLPLSLPHIWISLCTAFSLLLLCIVTGFFVPSLQFHLSGTLSNPEDLLWILNHAKF